MRELMERIPAGEASGTVATKEEMAVLRQYSGWGGLGTYFNDESSAENRMLRDLLTEDEYQDAAMSINSAYYTPATVVDTLWDVAKALGFAGGRVLEGSAGIGNIIGQMPREMSRRSDIEAVEIDTISGNILKLLYPDAKVHIQGFQDTVIPNGSVDLAITNVPFVTGLHVIDKVDKDLSRRFTNIHDFCIAKNIRKLREGGLGIFITSSGTMDKSNDLRAWIADEGKADVIGAFRLNNETFGGTKVTSDIIVVRKRRSGDSVATDDTAIDVSKASPMRVGVWTDKYGDEHQVSMVVNDYFKEHPEMMAGEMAFGYEKGDTFRPGSYGLYPAEGKEQGKMLAGFVKRMKEVGAATVSQQSGQAADAETERNQLTAVKEGRMLVDEKGRLCVSRLGEAVPLGLNEQKVKGYSKQQCFEDYQAVQKAVDDVLQQQLDDPDDSKLEPKLKALNAAFDKFVKRYGTLHKNTSLAFLRNDIDFPSFQALEDYSETKDMKGKVTVTTKKTPIFTQRVLGFKTEPKPKTVKDGVIASMFRSNGIDLEWIAERLSEVAAPPNGGKWTADDVRKGIIVSRLGFEDPSTGQIEIRYKYLSGNVREKLAIAEAYNTDGKYAANVEELRKAVPMDIPSHLIEFSIGSSWIPVELYKDYLKEVYDIDNISLSHVEGSWVMGDGWYRNEKNRAAGVYSEQFRETIYGHQLVVAAMNNRPVKVAKQVSEGYGSSKTTRTVVDKNATQACAVRVDEIKDEFRQWAKKKMQDDPELAARIEKIYNDKFNALVPMEIDKEFLPEHFEGSNVNITLRPHQKTGTMRGLTAPTMLAHEVGTGKSFTLITTAMEMRRLGTARKPMLVVQNATVAQLTSDAKLLYPNAKVLALTEKDRDAEGRRAFYASIKYNDWDLIIIPQSTLNMIPDSPERELQFIQEKIDEKKHVIEAAMQSGMDSREIQRLKKELDKLEEEYGDTFLDSDPANGGSRGKKKKKDAKREAASLDKAETKAKEQLDRQTDDVQYFDDLGVDALLVDEAHEYKHLGFQTSIGRGIKGVDPSYSKKCAGLYNKTRSVFEKAGWKNVVFATGTPISNTAAEIWTFMKYLMPADLMRANDIYYFDDFVHNFGSISQSLEFATSGKFKENTRFAAYVNKPELIRIWSQVADIVRTDDAEGVKDKLPQKEGGKDQDIFLPQSPSLVRIMTAVRAELERFENMTGQQKKENSSIPLTMYGIAKRAAIDPRLVDPNAPDEPMSKTNSAVKEIVKDLKATESYKGTVAVFCDNQNRLGTNAAGKKVVEFNIYDDMKQKLIKAGVPESQISIIKSGMSITAKQKVFDAVNAGTIRVVLGSTQTLGTGVNMQERLHLLIHMDAPDRPMDYTQRNGRIERQGNLHKEWGKTIRIVRFGVEDSLDVTAYQRLKTKSGFIDSIMDGKSALANNQVDRTVEEEEEGLFDNPVAVLSGSQYALKKNQAERELRRYEGKKAQWEADQVYVANALRRNKGVVADAERQIGEEQQMLEHIRSLFPDGKVNTITIQGEQVDAGNTEQLAKVMKEKVNDPVNAIVKRNRENAFYNDEVIPVTIELDGHAINFEVSVERESVYDGGKMRTVIHKYVTYKSADLREERLMKSSSSVKDLLDEILDEVVTGRDYQERIEFLQQKIARVNGESEQLQQRVGMEFQFGKELEEAKKRVEEYTQLMKEEMAEKEAKYAAESGGRDDIATYMTEEEDSELYRADEDEEMLNSDDESMSSEELLLSLSEKEGDERNETINELIRRVRSGAARIVRMGQEVRSDGSSDAEIAGTIVGLWGQLRLRELADETLRGVVPGRSSLVHGSRAQVEAIASDCQLAIVSWAKTSGSYISREEIEAISLDKAVWRSGAESDVYRTSDGKKLVKFTETWVYFQNPLLKRMDSIALGNAAGFVPSTVLGFSVDDKGHLKTVVEQDFVDGVTIDEVFDDDGPARVNAYLNKYLESVLGLENAGRDENGNQVHKKDGLIYKDIHGANVLMDRQGTLHIIDGYVSREGDDQKERGAGFSIEDADGDMLREVEQFADGERFDIHTTYGYGNDVLSRGRTFSTDLMPDEYGSVGELVDALRRQYPAYYVCLDGDAVRFERWASVFEAATMSQHRRTRKGTENYLRRKTNNAVGAVWSLAQRMGLDVEVLTSVEGLEGKRARSKGWFNPKTGKITIVLPNHSNQGDIINTLLHEGVAHYGLRKLFGPYFDTFLDNVYNNVDAQVRARIDAAVKKNGWSRHVATEEYLARLAERTDFEHASEYGWWRKIKQFFLKMLADAGLVMSTPLSDNDLRYLLWRSYDNLLHPDSRRSLFDKAREVQMKSRLSVRREVLADASVQGRAAMASQQTERAADSGTEVADVNNRLLLERMHRDLKKKYPGALIVFKMPDGSLKAVGADIDAVASAFGRGAWGNDSETEYNVPEERIDWLLPRLVRMGYRIGITDAPTGDVAREGEDIVWYDEASALSDADLLYSLRTKKAPKKTGIGYKVFVLKDGQLYPPMVANPGGEGTPVGVWLDADAAPIAGQSKTGRPQVKAGGKGTQGGSGQLAYRPGWHLGTIPYALQFNRKDTTGERTLFPNNFVWAEVEYADDVDYQDEARQEGVNANGKYQHSLAGLKHVPTDGSYRYRTNPDPRTDEWIITGAMRVNRILSRAEVDDMVRQAGREPQPMQDGDILTQDIVDELNAEIQATREADEMGLLFRADEDGKETAVNVARRIYEDAIMDTGDRMMIPALLWSMLPHKGRSEKWTRFKHKFSESYFDYSRSIKALQDAIEKATGRKIEGFEDVWRSLNSKSSIDSVEIQKVMHDYIEPMSEFVGQMIKGREMDGRRLELDDVEKYLNAVHGLERNPAMAMKQAQDEYDEDVRLLRQQLDNGELSEDERSSLEFTLLKKEARFKGIKDYMDNADIAEWYRSWQREVEYAHRSGSLSDADYARRQQSMAEEYEHGWQYKYRSRDYSGLTALFADEFEGDEPTEEQLEQAARDYASKFEAIVGKDQTDELWKYVKSLNGYSLKKSYESGLLSKEQYQNTLSMYEHYVPLRGWHDDYAGDVYQYISRGEPAEVLQGVLKKAYGRKSRAARVLGTMAAMANTAIVQGNKNLVAQRLLNMAMNHKDSGLLMVSEQWYQKMADGNLVPMQPALREGMSADEMREELESFEERMKAEEEKGNVISVRTKFKNEMPLHMAKWQERQHCVRVMRGGKEYLVYVLGSPRAAEAFNGLLNPHSQPGAVSNVISRWMRHLAKFQTSLSPEFLLSNFERDVMTASTSAYVKFGEDYRKQFAGNLTRVMPLTRAMVHKLKGKKADNIGGIFSLLRKYDAGTLDDHDETERLFKEFVGFGGMTGISYITKAEEYQSSMEQVVKRMREGKFGKVRNGWEALGDGVEFLNKGIENATRFATYMTSRQRGRSVRDSIFDAKEASVNFNMKGSGAWGNMLARRLYLYVNPAMQALRMLGEWYANDPRIAVRKGGAMVAKKAAGRFVKAAAMTFVASVLTGVINSVLSELMGHGGDGDDDDDKEGDWWALSEWNRYNYANLISPFSRGYFHWSIPQELRPLWALGQITIDMVTGHVTWQRGVHSMALQLNNLSPLSFFEGGTDTDESVISSELRALTPSYVSPFTDALLWNRDFMGHKVTSQGPWNKDLPEWQRAGKDTPGILVTVSRRWNELTGGRRNSKGWGDSPYLNPSVVYYVTMQQFGGLGTMASRLLNLADQVFDSDQDVELRNIPFVPKVYVSTGDDYSKDRVMNEKFWMYYNEYQAADDEMVKDRRQVSAGEMSQAEADKTIRARQADGSYHTWEVINDNALKYVYEKVEGTELEKEVKQMVVDAVENGKVPDWQDRLERSSGSGMYKVWLKAVQMQRDARIEKLSDEEVAKAFDKSDDPFERQALAKRISIDAGASEDPYGDKPNGLSGAYYYQLNRTADDVREDALLYAYQEKARNAGDEELKKQVSNDRREAHSDVSFLHGGRSDDTWMDGIRRQRRRLLEKYGLLGE